MQVEGISPVTNELIDGIATLKAYVAQQAARIQQLQDEIATRDEQLRLKDDRITNLQSELDRLHEVEVERGHRKA